MCRLLAFVSDSPTTLNSVMGKNLAPFANLSHHHRDGWGVGTLTSGGVSIFKTKNSAFDDRLFQDFVQHESTEAAIVHFRRATGTIPVGDNEAHPFTDGTIAFAHNGWAFPQVELDRLVEEHEAGHRIGETDSESYFLLVKKFMADGDTPPEAIVRAATLISERCTAVALNCLLLTPEAVYALQWVNHVEAEHHDIDGGAQGLTLRYLVEPDRTIVTSNRWDPVEGNWQTLSNFELVTIFKDRSRPVQIDSVRDACPPANALAG